jgi:glycosyltransferase involved in cell wall biosynthesis
MSSLRIDLYANDGSPLGICPNDIYGRGVGGAELSMMTWAETMAARGHTVRVYNNPPAPGVYDGVEYLPQPAFQPSASRDVFVVYRSPNPFIRSAKAGVKIHWSTDQYTIGDFGRDIFPWVDRIVCISPFHVDYHRTRYNPDPAKIGYLDLGVRLGDYDQRPQGVEKIPGRCIFCSVPDRGLHLLRVMWPKIKEAVPHASLVITSDYTLWGAAPLNHEHRLSWLGQPDVIFLGKVERGQLVREQLAAECMPFACVYDELFCISAAECQVAGAAPITSDFGALPTTNEWGRVVRGNPLDGNWQREFVDTVVGVLSDKEKLAAMSFYARHEARRRFGWGRICQSWEHLIETGEFASFEMAQEGVMAVQGAPV